MSETGRRSETVKAGDKVLVTGGRYQGEKGVVEASDRAPWSKLLVVDLGWTKALVNDSNVEVTP
jgi:ribosomal protein L24